MTAETNEATTPPLSERLRAAAIGRQEWRVQDPKDGAYCIAFSREDGFSFDPERDARAWLAGHQKRFPDSPKAGYVVACVTVQTQAQRLLQEADEALMEFNNILSGYQRLYNEAMAALRATVDERDQLSALASQQRSHECPSGN